MNAADITFGIELETTLPAGVIAVGPHGAGLPIAQLPGWKADRDPSIRARNGRVACEFVSPVFKGAAGLRQMIADIETIKAMGATVNSRPFLALLILIADRRRWLGRAPAAATTATPPIRKETESWIG